MLGSQTKREGLILNFKVPVRKEQLCDEPANRNQFFVQERDNIQNIPENSVISKLEEISQQVCGSGSNCLKIMENDYFDFLYSVIYYVETQNS